MREEARQFGFGLRLQLVLTLLTAFACAFGLFYVTSIELAARAKQSGAIEKLDVLVRLWTFYGGLTAVVVLFLSYVALTYWIVRPIERVTRAAEQLASGDLRGAVPVGGAAEVARLSVAFNEMASQLRVERQRLEARVRELEATTKDLRATQDTLIMSEKLASVGRLAAGVAHEIGNPLAAVDGLLELIEPGATDAAEQREFITRARRETDRMQRIIRDLLDYARQGHTQRSPGATSDIRQVIEDAERLLSPQKEWRGITLYKEFEARLPIVEGDSNDWMQVIVNLFINAADAMDGNGTIHVTISEHDDRVRVSVQDSGPGLPQQVQDRLFEPFVTTKANGKGTGLGLAVCQAVVTRYGGRIIGDNAPGRGARFTLDLVGARS